MTWQILAQGGRFMAGWGLVDIIIAIIIIAAAIGIMYVALRVFGVAIPPWVVQIFWIVVVAFVAIFAIRLLFSM
jgi:hypothetical protein